MAIERQLSLTERLMFCTVKIKTTGNDGSNHSGTGFLFSFKENKNGQQLVCVVSNKHVVKDMKFGEIDIGISDDKQAPTFDEYETLYIDNFESKWIMHPETEIDLAVIPLAPHVGEIVRNKFLHIEPINFDLIPTHEQWNEFKAVEDVLMIGYPQGISDDYNNKPIFRKGITATHPNIDYEGAKNFVIDIPAIEGSSGSPIFLFNEGSFTDYKGEIQVGTQIKLLGILVGGYDLDDEGFKVKPIRKIKATVLSVNLNLGVAVKSNALKDFLPLLEDDGVN